MEYKELSNLLDELKSGYIQAYGFDAGNAMLQGFFQAHLEMLLTKTETTAQAKSAINRKIKELTLNILTKD